MNFIVHRSTRIRVVRHLHLVVLTFLLYVVSAVSAPSSDLLPGLWEQFDDKSGKLQALIRVSKLADGTYAGLVEKIIVEPGEDPNPRCEKCTDHRRDMPVLGMQIISGLKRTGDATYANGWILDPDEGESYRLRMSVGIDGNNLDVRGYVGISLFGRTQIWRRSTNLQK